MSDDKPSTSQPTAGPSKFDPMARLPSLKPPRDLTLGAGKANKKIFVPNLNVARLKNKGQSTSGNQGSQKGEGQAKKKEKPKVSRGPKIIKQTGVFSQGVGDADCRVKNAPETEGATSALKPAFEPKSPMKRNIAVTSVTGECSTKKKPHDVSSILFKSFVARDEPILLPLGAGSIHKPMSEIEVKEEMMRETQVPDSMLREKCEIGNQAPAEVKLEQGDPEVLDLLNMKEPTLILLQLPTSLPGYGGGPDDYQMNDEPSTSSQSDMPGGVDCNLSDIQDGRIGTLRTHRSGRVTILLGDSVFEVSKGTTPAFHQEVVSAATDHASRSAKLVSLGPLSHTLSIVPQWETLLENMNKPRFAPDTEPK